MSTFRVPLPTDSAYTNHSVLSQEYLSMSDYDKENLPLLSNSKAALPKTKLTQKQLNQLLSLIDVEDGQAHEELRSAPTSGRKKASRWLE